MVRLGENLQVSDETPAAGFAHTLLLRRSVSDPTDVTFFLAHAPDPTPAATLITISGTRWKRWRQLQRFTGRRELLPDTINAAAGIVSDRSAGLTW